MPDREACIGERADWNDSLTGHFLWSNVNFGEAVTEVMTPPTWSVTQFTLDWPEGPTAQEEGESPGNPQPVAMNHV
jgi:hypothetical protein